MGLARNPENIMEKQEKTPRETAEIIQKWLSDQKYQGQNLLHPSVCCDHAGMMHFIDALERIIKDGEVYCHPCSIAGGARMPIYHEYPACKE